MDRIWDTATHVPMVHGVKHFLFDPARWDQVHSRGLPTDEGPSTVYVEFDTPDDETEISKDSKVVKVRQMVPVDFLPGAFFCSVTGRVQRRGSASKHSWKTFITERDFN